MESKVVKQISYGDIEICRYDNDEDIVMYGENGEVMILILPKSLPDLIAALKSFLPKD